MYRTNPENQPIQHVALFNETSVGSGDSILGSDHLVPKVPPSMFRIMVCLETSAKFSVQLTQDSTTKDLILNNDAKLGGNCLYIFDMLVTSSDVSINFEQAHEGNTINVLVVQEILVATQ